MARIEFGLVGRADLSPGITLNREGVNGAEFGFLEYLTEHSLREAGNTISPEEVFAAICATNELSDLFLEKRKNKKVHEAVEFTIRLPSGEHTFWARELIP